MKKDRHTIRREQGWVRSLWRALVFPIVFGIAMGFAFVTSFMQLDECVSSAYSPDTAESTPTPQSRSVILLLDNEQTQAVGMWQWWPAPQSIACVLSIDQLITPPGRTVDEIMTRALGVGDNTWVAQNTQAFAASCRPEPEQSGYRVVSVSQEGFISLVTALGGIEIQGEDWDGMRAWKCLISPDLTADESQVRQADIWLAISEQVRADSSSICDQIPNQQRLFWSVPAQDNPCRQLVSVLRQTPADIILP